MRTSRRFLVILLTTLLCGIFATGCDDIVTDPNFHTWCGDQLCSWKLESGQIRRAPTWNEKDYGVELFDGAAISQVADTAAHCLEFSTVADVVPEAQVFIGLDFNNDGTVDTEQQIAATGFVEQKTQITGPVGYDGLRFIISKKGTGRAVLAQMAVKSKDSCTAPPVVLKGQSLGGRCTPALAGEECSSGICCSGHCSECCGLDSCPNAGTCTEVGAEPIFSAYQCDPGKGTRTAGSECLGDADCMSHKCGQGTPGHLGRCQ